MSENLRANYEVALKRLEESNLRARNLAATIQGFANQVKDWHTTKVVQKDGTFTARVHDQPLERDKWPNVDDVVKAITDCHVAENAVCFWWKLLKDAKQTSGLKLPPDHCQ
jgi:hypothetical protein